MRGKRAKRIRRELAAAVAPVPMNERPAFFISVARTCRRLFLTTPPGERPALTFYRQTPKRKIATREMKRCWKQLKWLPRLHLLHQTGMKINEQARKT